MAVGYNPSIVTDGLVLALDAANPKSYPGSGTTWSDLSGNGNNGTLTNGVGYSSANKGSLVFDGVDDRILDTSTTNLPLGNSNRTISIWYYSTTASYNLVQIGTGGSGTGTQAYIVSVAIFGANTFIYTDGINSPNNLIISGDQIPQLNVWNNFVFGNSGQNFFYYLNSELKLSGTWPITLNTVGQQYSIGIRLDVAPSPFNGNIAQTSIYNRALTAAEIQQNFNALKGRYGI